jgi:hypothetical protein
MNEEWKDIIIEVNGKIYDYSGRYMVSNTGKVFSVKAGRCLKPSKAGSGYLVVNLGSGNNHTKCYIHRLVATMFIPNPHDLPQVNHKDENKKNNNVSNLEWCDSCYNINYGSHNEKVSQTRINKKLSKNEKNYFYGKKFYGSNNGNAKAVICTTTGERFETINDAVEWVGMKIQSGISMCCHGKQKHAGKHPVTGEKLSWIFYENFSNTKENDINE